MTPKDFYIGGTWVSAQSAKRLDVFNPATELPITSIAMASEADVDRAVSAAAAAYPEYSRSSREERRALLCRILAAYTARLDEMAEVISQEVGAPILLSQEAQAACGIAHIEAMIAVLDGFAFERPQGTTQILYEPVGVCGLITPWNWPINQIACKVLPALAAGCTMVLKPSELSPLNALLWAEIMHDAGVPPGVFNLINGDGIVAGASLSRHPLVDMVSFTGSTRAGIEIAKAGAETVKRVHQELGGKSANILLPDADFDSAVRKGVQSCFMNSGQTCDAPTRMLVPSERMDEVAAIAAHEASLCVVGDPSDQTTTLGPVISQGQWEKIQDLIQSGLAEGATLVAGGRGKPEGLAKGHFVRPTIFSNVTPEMRVAREEIFGPVLVIMGYADEAEAIRIANDSPYGLAGYVQSGDIEKARRIARQLRAGGIHLNYPDMDFSAPFGGYKQSGNGRECGVWGLHDFLEIKAITGFRPVDS
ncbi:Aldehyde Dehydrogenase [Sphingobium chlorophenolicum L-1]|uniref:Aldehyde Dehydrogenase n=1 Tax=Sphingobium chlorophenolicum L-1 TaxID=690566 RepID=F6EWZ6_SPHCR|nr:aldehyde dehydrogenase family protein [Sphingobium chlorophenolicum]AEG48159.1 Aldehyde Dehydrogenase [Sphingobium chlorophenolicum L-1]